MDDMLRTLRLVEYELFRKPTLEEFKEGFEYEANIYHGSLSKNISELPEADSILCHYTENGMCYFPIKWGKFTVTEHDEKYKKDYFKSLLDKHFVRVRNKFDTVKLRNLGWKLPLVFSLWNDKELKKHIIRLFPPVGNSTTRIYSIDGDFNPKQKPALLYSNDWHNLVLTPEELKRGGKSLKPPEPENEIFKHFDLNQIPYNNMTTKELGRLLEDKALNFKYDDLDLLVLPKPKKEKYETHEVYVNGIEQYSITYYSKLHEDWFRESKDSDKEFSAFRDDWRILLQLNGSELGFDSATNVVPSYYKGVVEKVDVHIEDQLQKNKSGIYERATELIRNLLNERHTNGKKS